ncbi:hypothetical protein LCGC14_0564820 [marine sediment metagenome]|uniref:Uncharacterized protein n=1 Tax=marine sediment metagenome TaxID=412755 RepID=A0A0F9RR22_9ZZZZ
MGRLESLFGNVVLPALGLGLDINDTFGQEGTKAAARRTNEAFEEGAKKLGDLSGRTFPERQKIAGDFKATATGIVEGAQRASSADLALEESRFFQADPGQSNALDAQQVALDEEIQTLVQDGVSGAGGAEAFEERVKAVKKQQKTLDDARKLLDTTGRFSAANKEQDAIRRVELDTAIGAFQTDVESAVSNALSVVHTNFSDLKIRAADAVKLAQTDKGVALNNVTKDYGAATMQALAGARQQRQAAIDQLNKTWQGPRDNRYQAAVRNIEQQFSAIGAAAGQQAAANYGNIRSQVELVHNTSINNLNASLESSIAGAASAVARTEVAGAGIRAGAAGQVVSLRDASGRLTQAGAQTALLNDDAVRESFRLTRQSIRDVARNDNMQIEGLYVTMISDAITERNSLDAQHAGALMNWVVNVAPTAQIAWNSLAAFENREDSRIQREQVEASRPKSNIGGSLINTAGLLGAAALG